MQKNIKNNVLLIFILNLKKNLRFYGCGSYNYCYLSLITHTITTTIIRVSDVHIMYTDYMSGNMMQRIFIVFI